MYAWSVPSMLLFLHSAFLLSVVKILLKREAGGRALKKTMEITLLIIEKSINCVFEFLWEHCGRGPTMVDDSPTR